MTTVTKDLPCNAASSMGSPAKVGSLPPGEATDTMLWQAARTSVAAAALPLMGTTGGGVASEDVLTTPWGTSWSVVRVPVLSKRQCATLPARGTRKGSMHMMPTWRG